MVEKLNKALLIFAKKPLPGKVKTRMVPPLSPLQAAELYGCMLGDVLAKAARYAAAEGRFLFYEEADQAGEYFTGRSGGMTSLPQCGADLGERMAEAFRAVFARGYGAAVVIGTDAPDLPLHFIDMAFQRLEGGDCEAVFGPCEDGGYYLLGMKKLHSQLFRDVPWSSGAVLQVSLQRAWDAGIAVSLLPSWHDVDTAADLERPELLAEENGALLTREFLGKLVLGR
ncbi:MAG TPA: TIGR04282 family arsenosugar biosynthesis glycosyltransferase [Geobacteraceae bacterium]